MDGFELYSQLAFGTTFDPKKPRKRKNKLQNYKRNKRRRFEESQKEEDENISDKNISSDDNSSDLSDDSDSDPGPSTETPKSPKKRSKKKKLSTMQLCKIRKEEVTHFRRIHKIYITGEDVPDPLENFSQLVADYDVSSTILDNIKNLGYSNPTPIQMQAVPLMMHNRQILACAPTGSGKTAAFLIPLIHNLKGPEKGGIRAVILAPTRELVKQTYSFCVKLSEGTGLRPLIIENVNDVKDRPKFLRKHDILISTPNRLIYLLKNDPPSIKLNKVQWLIVDECDKLFEVGKEEKSFRDQLAFIYNACDSSFLKRAMFSATYRHEVEEWCKLNLDSLVCVSIGTKNTAVTSVKQELLFTGWESGKLLAIKNFLLEGFTPPCLIFVQSKERAKELYSEIAFQYSKVDVIHSDLTQEQRDKVTQNFTDGKIWVLICTELMGRGIDFQDVQVVINYDFPTTAIEYIHRIGRTGRAGKTGRAITYFTTDDVENLKNIAQVIKNAGCEVPEYIMSLKTKKKKNEFQRPIKRQKISTAPVYDLQKQSRKRKMIQNSIKKKTDENSMKKKLKDKTENPLKEKTENPLKKRLKEKTENSMKKNRTGKNSIKKKLKKKTVA